VVFLEGLGTREGLGVGALSNLGGAHLRESFVRVFLVCDWHIQLYLKIGGDRECKNSSEYLRFVPIFEK
jgi:hypothetical protein